MGSLTPSCPGVCDRAEDAAEEEEGSGTDAVPPGARGNNHWSHTLISSIAADTVAFNCAWVTKLPLKLAEGERLTTALPSENEAPCGTSPGGSAGGAEGDEVPCTGLFAGGGASLAAKVPTRPC
jgi:hypothetical protein